MNAEAGNSADAINTTDSDDKNENLLDSGMTQEEKNAKNFKPAMAYFVLFLTLIARITVQWQRKGLNYAYGFTGTGD